jgi:membrane-associated protein
MFVGFFFPGDSLLLGAGIFAAQGHMNLGLLIVSVAFAAFLGDNLGYLIGRKYGRPLFEKPDGIVFNPKHLHHAESFFWKYGSKAMLVTHFVPVVRTFAPAAAGISHMHHKRFIFFDAIGVLMWTVGITLIGYFFGSKIPNIEHYLHYVFIFIIAITLIPTIYHLVKAFVERAKIRRELKAKADLANAKNPSKTS